MICHTTETYTSEQLCDLGIRAIKKIVASLIDQYAERPETAVIPLADLRSGKPMITADKDAELLFERFVRTVDRKRFKHINFYGEETLDDAVEPIKLSGKQGTFVLVDALDGSDLYERNLGNWCSAATFFTPGNAPGKRIRAAIAGTPDRAIFFSTDSSPGVQVIRKPRSPVENAGGMSRVERIEKASICFYGQKVGQFIGAAKSPLWGLMRERDLAHRKKKPDGIGLRIYNLGGIPMILRLIDKVVKKGHGIDAVVDFNGQKAHDIVPGAFFAMKAGAQIMGLDRSPITIQRLEELLLKPNTERLTYIISATKELGNEIANFNLRQRRRRSTK
jgi:fructose-1,6-bisphosphatase/inositol monophosphatase family enzyme